MMAAGAVQRVALDPVSRVAGPLSLHATIDFDRGEVVESAALATLFRGYELILKDRDARDAVFISSRACGVCGGAHGSCAALATEMAFGIPPPPMGIAARNLMSALEYLFDLPLALFVRGGPDYSRPTVERTSPELWQRAERTRAPASATHGFERISDIMTALTPVDGELYLEALGMSRLALEAYVVLGGKYPHPQTLVPGGVSATIDTQALNEVLLKVVPFIDYGKRGVASWNDVVDFFYDADPRYRQLGALPPSFIALGQWDDPLAYDAKLENCAEWGRRRWATPGAIVDGRLLTPSLPEIDGRVEEFVAHSFYADWSDQADRATTAEPAPAVNHPGAKETIPEPGETDLGGKYSWSTAPRWDRQAMDTGAYAQLWTTALAAELPHRRFIEPTGQSLRLAMPQGKLAATELEWRVPERWGTLERTRARAYALAYATLVAYEHALIGLDFQRTGEERVSTRFKVPKDARAGTGFWATARGSLSHHMSVDGGVIDNYQILAPSTWTVSPRDALGNPGPCERAVMAMPLISRGAGEGGGAEAAGMIDILRTIRSFDPCIPCATH